MKLTWFELGTAFAGQARYCIGYSPLYAAIFEYLAQIASQYATDQPLEFDAQAFIDLLEAEWADRPQLTLAEAPLLISAALHAAVLQESREAAGLSRFYETVGGSYEPEYDHEVLLQALGGVFLNPAAALRRILRTGNLQTNEVSRGALWLLTALIEGARTPDMPITLVDLGCSAGLNLAADAQAWRWIAADGDRQLGADDPLITQPLDLGHADPWIREKLPAGKLTAPHILKRIGLDLNPLRLDSPDDLLLLRACIWGDQAARLERFDRAVSTFERLQPAPQIETVNIITAARTLHTRIAPGTRLLLVYNTIVTLYLNDTDYADLHANIAAAFRDLPPDVRGLWIEHEFPRHGEPGVPPKLYALKAHTLENGVLRMRYLAYTEAHPQTIMLLAGWPNGA